MHCIKYGKKNKANYYSTINYIQKDDETKFMDSLLTCIPDDHIKLSCPSFEPKMKPETNSIKKSKIANQNLSKHSDPFEILRLLVLINPNRSDEYGKWFEIIYIYIKKKLVRVTYDMSFFRIYILMK